MGITQLIDKWRTIGLMAWSESKYGWITDDNRPIVLADWQRTALSALAAHTDVQTVFLSAPKKSGKTLINSLILAYRWLTLPGVHFCLGNDFDQGAMLQSDMIAEMVKRHPLLKRYVKSTVKELLFKPTGSRLITLPADYAGSSGHNFLTVSFTELWAFTYESHLRLFEELTPPPLVGALRICDSYAGFEEESLLLEMLWQRAEKGKPIGDNLTLQGQQLSYIAQDEDGHKRTWRGTEAQRQAYLTEQRETLREGSYRRLHLNRWAASEDIFITPELWRNLVDYDYRLPAPDKSIKLYVACDIGVKRDHSAVVSVFWQDNDLRLGPYRIWKPTAGREVDLQSVEDYLHELWQAWGIAAMVGDPSQFLHIKQRLQKAGLQVGEFVQSVTRLTEAGNTLFDVIRQIRLRVYPGATDLKQYVLNAKAKETPRGIRLIKDVNSKKIDAAIALGMAVTEASSKRGWRGGIEFLSVSGSNNGSPPQPDTGYIACPTCKQPISTKARREYLACSYCGWDEKLTEFPAPERQPKSILYF